jgi:large conductance mechanosensitive channel
MLKEFKEFISRGNVLDLAVAVILGVAFGAIVTSLVDDIIMPIVGALIGGIDFSGLAITVGEASIGYGNFLQSVVNFLIVAFAVFLFVKSINEMQKRMMRAEEKPPEVPPEPSGEEKLLMEIRDLLRDRGTAV